MLGRIELQSEEIAIETDRRKALFYANCEHRKEISKLLRKIDLANETIVHVENRERCSGKRLNDKLDSIRKRIIVVLIVVFSINVLFDSEGLIFMAIFLYSEMK